MSSGSDDSEKNMISKLKVRYLTAQTTQSEKNYYVAPVIPKKEQYLRYPCKVNLLTLMQCYLNVESDQFDKLETDQLQSN